MKKFLLLLLLLLLAAPGAVGAIDLNLNYPEFGGFDLDREQDQSLEGLIAWLYYAIVGISGIAAFVMLVWGGIQWMSSAGNPAAIGDATDRIKKALLGLLLVLSSFIIIQIINPELTILKSPFSQSSPSTSKQAGSSPQQPPHQAESAPAGSSGAPLPGQQAKCLGPGSFEKNTGATLQTMAEFICSNAGHVPADASIHLTLAQQVGPENCTQQDVDAVRSLLVFNTTCGKQGSAGAEVDGLTIDQATVPAQLCTFNATLGNSDGVAYSSAIVSKDFILTPQHKEQREQALDMMKSNLREVSEHCNQEVNKSKPYCALQDANATPIAALDETQREALARYCIDIVLGVGS